MKSDNIRCEQWKAVGLMMRKPTIELGCRAASARRHATFNYWKLHLTPTPPLNLTVKLEQVL